MSIHFISGKPGGGKSLFAVKKVVDELLLTRRVIVTNLSLKLPELNEYLQKVYPDKSVDLLSRIILMSEEETAKFWLIRPDGYKLKECSGGKEGAMLVKDWKHAFNADVVNEAGEPTPFPITDLPSVLYIIDELHIYFNARAWMATGKDALFYLSQHRKFGDDVICITQSINNVDKQFRSVAQEFIYIRNHAKERIGLFRSIGGFSRSHYLQPATGAPGEKSMETGFFRLDVTGLCQCYDTAAGVGVIGRSADTTAPKRGLPIWMLIALVVLVCVAVGLVPRIMAGGLGSLSRSARPTPKTNSVSHATNVFVPAPAVAPAFVTPSATNQPVKVPPAPIPARLRGISIVGSRGTAYFDDGSMVTTDDPRVRRMGTDYVVVDQTVYRISSATVSRESSSPMPRPVR